MGIDDEGRIEVVIKADESQGQNAVPFVGTVSGQSKLVEVDLTLSAGSYSKDDVLADTQVLTNAVRDDGAIAIWQSCVLINKGDNSTEIDVLLLKNSTSIGTENAAVSISAANAVNILGKWSFESDDYIDLVNSQMCQQENIGILVKPDSDSSDLYVAAIDRSGDTHVQNGIHLKLGFLWETVNETD